MPFVCTRLAEDISRAIENRSERKPEWDTIDAIEQEERGLSRGTI